MGFFVSEKNNKAITPIIDTLTGDGGTGYTMTIAPPSEDHIMVYVGGALQEPTTAYTVSGTTITFTGTVASGIQIIVIHGAYSI